MRRSKTTSVFDHLVGSGKQACRQHKTEQLGSLEVDDKRELRRRLHPSAFALRKPPTTGYPDKKGSMSELQQ
jgi:hypothetical protein